MDLIIEGPALAARTVILAHGAGLPMDAPFMAEFAGALAAGGHRVVRFEFPYMASRRETGSRRPPDRAPKLMECFREAIDLAKAPKGGLILAGKSMGGRMATMIADDAGAAAVLVFGYPFHPGNKPENLRVEHLKTLKTPTLICQGTRDGLGNQEEVSGYDLSAAISLCWLPDGDHDFKPRVASGHTIKANWENAQSASIKFLGSLGS